MAYLVDRVDQEHRASQVIVKVEVPGKEQCQFYW